MVDVDEELVELGIGERREGWQGTLGIDAVSCISERAS
jgi:hypothetical protein